MAADKTVEMRSGGHYRPLHPGDVGDQGVGAEQGQMVDYGRWRPRQDDEVRPLGSRCRPTKPPHHRTHLESLLQGGGIGIPTDHLPPQIAQSEARSMSRSARCR